MCPEETLPSWVDLNRLWEMLGRCICSGCTKIRICSCTFRVLRDKLLFLQGRLALITVQAHGLLLLAPLQLLAHALPLHYLRLLNDIPFLSGDPLPPQGFHPRCFLQYTLHFHRTSLQLSLPLLLQPPVIKLLLQVTIILLPPVLAFLPPLAFRSPPVSSALPPLHVAF